MAISDYRVATVAGASSALGREAGEAFAVAAMLEKMGFAARWTGRASPSFLLADLEPWIPHCVVLVLAAPARTDPTGWEYPAGLARAYRQAGLAVVAVRLGGSPVALAACMEHGALGVERLEDLPDALCVLSGTRAQPRDSANHSGPAAPSAAKDPRLVGLGRLTAAERKVLFHLVEGRSAQEIADLYVLSLSTVRSHIRSILRSLDVTSQLAAVAVANGAQPSHRT